MPRILSIPELDLAIRGGVLITPAGRGTAPSMAAWRAGICAFEEHAVVRASDDEHGIVVARCEGIGWAAPLRLRVAVLLDLARTAWGGAPPELLLLDAPVSRCGDVEVAGWRVRVSDRGGDVAALLEDARRAIRAREAKSVVVGAVDSLLDVAELAVRVAAGLRPGGPIPAEGIALVHVGPVADDAIAVLRAGPRSRARVAGIFDPSGIGSLIGEVAQHAPFSAVFADLDGQAERGEELAVAMMRQAGHFIERVPVHHVTDCFGAMGGAAGLALLLAAAERPPGWRRGDQHLVVSWSGARAALALEPIA